MTDISDIIEKLNDSILGLLTTLMGGWLFFKTLQRQKKSYVFTRIGVSILLLWLVATPLTKVNYGEEIIMLAVGGTNPPTTPPDPPPTSPPKEEKKEKEKDKKKVEEEPSKITEKSSTEWFSTC